MALAFTNRASQFITTNATSYVSSTSFTPTAGNLMVLVGYWSSTDTAEVQPTSVSGNGVTYSRHATTQFVSGVCSGSVWVGIVPASPTLGSVTVSGFSTARTGVSFQIWEISGADTSGTALAAIANVIKGGPATATSGSVTMTGPLNTGNLCCGFFDHTASENLTAGTGNTLDATGNYATPSRGAGGVHNTGTTYANPAASWTTSAAWRGFGVEIKAAPAGGTNWTDNENDSVTMSDAQAFDQGHVLADSVTMSDAQAFQRSWTVADSVAMSDTVAFDRQVTVSDSVTMSDGVAANRGISQSVADSVTMSDGTLQESGKGASIADSVTMSDATAFQFSVTLTDSVTMSDGVALQRSVNLTVADSVTMSDTVAFQRSWTISDTITMSDALAFQRGVTVTDTVTLSDGVSTSTTTIGGATPPITVRTFLVGSSGLTRAHSALSATSATGSNMATQLTGLSGATHATGTSGRTRT